MVYDKNIFEISANQKAPLAWVDMLNFGIGKERYIGDTRNIVIKVFLIKSDIKTDMWKL